MTLQEKAIAKRVRKQVRNLKLVGLGGLKFIEKVKNA